jgi:hypothetical protein
MAKLYLRVQVQLETIPQGTQIEPPERRQGLSDCDVSGLAAWPGHSHFFQRKTASGPTAARTITTIATKYPYSHCSSGMNLKFMP